MSLDSTTTLLRSATEAKDGPVSGHQAPRLVWTAPPQAAASSRGLVRVWRTHGRRPPPTLRRWSQASAVPAEYLPRAFSARGASGPPDPPARADGSTAAGQAPGRPVCPSSLPATSPRGAVKPSHRPLAAAGPSRGRARGRRGPAAGLGRGRGPAAGLGRDGDGGEGRTVLLRVWMNAYEAPAWEPKETECRMAGEARRALECGTHVGATSRWLVETGPHSHPGASSGSARAEESGASR